SADELHCGEFALAVRYGEGAAQADRARPIRRVLFRVRKWRLGRLWTRAAHRDLCTREIQGNRRGLSESPCDRDFIAQGAVVGGVQVRHFEPELVAHKRD